MRMAALLWPSVTVLVASGAGDAAVAALLALAAGLAPALGVPHEEMLQDTFKSIVVSFGALLAALLFFWVRLSRPADLRWHALLALPLGLMAYALASMAWSHSYLAGVEAVRWFVFSLLLFLALNTFTRERLAWLALGVHAGAAIASLWAVLQFWFDWHFFPQGPRPSSTFINRNFFAEFAVCTLPFGFMLLARARTTRRIALLASTCGLVVLAVLMTGTRSALIALGLLALLLPLAAWRLRHALAFSEWDAGQRGLAVFVLLFTTLGLGALETGSAAIEQEGRGLTALQRATNRAASIRPDDTSLGLRVQMWQATLRMIADRPVTGVGAGAWENEVPRYQAEGSPLETDYYVHNEYLQLLAEYGLVGGVFLVLLAAYGVSAAWRTACTMRMMRSDDEEAAWRAVLLFALLALAVVSAIGFPWRLASTGALFALCLGALAASDVRLGRWRVAGLIAWSRGRSSMALLAVSACLVLATWVTVQAAQSERKLVRAARIATSLSRMGMANDPRAAPARAEMLRLVREGIAINPHYRKITPMVADDLARWGDWRNAVWIWESVLASRPNVVGIMTNVSRGYSELGEPQRAMEWLARARLLQPKAAPVRSLEVVLLSRAGQLGEALAVAEGSLDEGIFDRDLVNAAFVLAWRAGNHALALRAMEIKLARWPDERLASYLQLGRFYDEALGDENQALQAFGKSVALAAPQQRAWVREQVPLGYRERLGLQSP